MPEIERPTSFGGSSVRRSRAEAVAPRFGGSAVVEVVRRHGPAFAGYALPFLLVLYLALKGGGYDPLVRGEVGIAVWWIVLLGVAAGVLPATRVTRLGWIALGLLAALAAWTALATTWSESQERTALELARALTYLGVFALAVLAQGRESLRRIVWGVGAAIGLVAILALASRLEPSWFPDNGGEGILRAAETRLNYPLNYWNGLAALMAMGIPLLLVIADRARLIVTQAAATAAVPVLALVVYYTLSRGGAVETALALATLLALYPRRLALLPTLALGVVGSALLIGAASQRDALQDGLGNAAASSQANEMLAMVLVVCAGVALLRVAIGLAVKHGIGPRVQVSRSGAQIGVAAVAIVAIVGALALGAPGELSDAWDEFKQPVGESNSSAERFTSASGNGRYEYWQRALDAGASDPLKGIGPGTFEFWWSRNGTIPGFVRDAHSLYLETYAELGLIGIALLVALLVAILATGVSRAMRTGSSDRRALIAAAVAACVAFVVAGVVDWVWELAVLPLAFLILAAGLLGPSAESRGRSRSSRFVGAVPTPVRAGAAAVAVLALIGIAIPLAGTASVRESQREAGEAQLGPALDSARSAGNVQPYASSPHLQEALVLELSGDFGAATKAATSATEEEPTNWRTWLVLSRLEAERGNAQASVAAYREARSLNPRSPLFP